MVGGIPRPVNRNKRPVAGIHTVRGTKAVKARYQHIAKGFWRLLFFGVIFSQFVRAQGVSTQQVITLQVMELNKITVNLNTVHLLIDQASFEQGQPLPAENSAGTLVWTTNGDNKKITVSSNQASPRFTLKLLAQPENNADIAAPEITLNDNTIHDLVTGVSRRSGKCRIRLNASATLSDGVGTENHVITYTITSS